MQLTPLESTLIPVQNRHRKAYLIILTGIYNKCAS